jgi:hypothetical protein
MHEYIPVAPGINLTQHLAANTKHGRITKVWVRQVMREHPEWDWRNLGLNGGTYLNGEDAAKHDLTLQVMENGTTKAMVNFKVDVNQPSGVIAVVS